MASILKIVRGLLVFGGVLAASSVLNVLYKSNTKNADLLSQLSNIDAPVAHADVPSAAPSCAAPDCGPAPDCGSGTGSSSGTGGC